MEETQEKSHPGKPGSSSRGVSRVLGKLRASVESKNFYEAHQMYRTLYFRYVSQGKYADVLELLYDGALTMLEHEQYSSGADLGLLIIQTLEKAGSTVETPEQWIKRLAELVSKIKPTVVDREALLDRAMKWSGSLVSSPTGHPLMHKLFAQILYREGDLTLARRHFALAKDGVSCGFLLIEISCAKGFPGEVDLFVGHTVLQQLALKEPATAASTFATYCKFHASIACTEPPFAMPLLNFLHFLLALVEQNNRMYATFRALCELYKPSLDRDPSYEKYLQKIGVKFFDGSRYEQRNFMFSDLLQQFFIDLEEDELEEGTTMHGEVD
ncbi:Golgi to ER traffic protein 4 homolog [Anopheles arabiensis]|uniref:Golgi to ER traffic protein 4 homolog n=4 Tax=gambiae species complex TaxID=44542 RepID=A0ABM2A8F8_ANOCL|nr:Golgi to ER traffic protein 4 homolog [Anopheles arabiensis]XP_040219607.1 Golgi to ER traffic protein 4 homolog [Anopheles coluzzii]XP_311026.5 Golgi to ER traffic protein 4 homolog isoform X2 [Anopheles gambiae]